MMGEERTYFYDLLLYIIRYIVALQLLKIQRLSVSLLFIYQEHLIGCLYLFTLRHLKFLTYYISFSQTYK